MTTGPRRRQAVRAVWSAVARGRRGRSTRLWAEGTTANREHITVKIKGDPATWYACTPACWCWDQGGAPVDPERLRSLVQ